MWTGIRAFVPKGLKDSAWGFNPRYDKKKNRRPEGVTEPKLR
jgi:hypothetical protein